MNKELENIAENHRNQIEGFKKEAIDFRHDIQEYENLFLKQVNLQKQLLNCSLLNMPKMEASLQSQLKKVESTLRATDYYKYKVSLKRQNQLELEYLKKYIKERYD